MTKSIPVSGAASILVINAGSSSIKFALFREADPPVPVTRGLIDRIGHPDSVMVVNDVSTNRSTRHMVDAQDHQASVGCLMEWLAKNVGMENLRAVGHRVVHGGMRFGRPECVTLDMLAEAPPGSLTFVNLVDFDTLFGHRRDVAGYAAALEAFDRRLSALRAAMRPGDLALISADHGCDPTAAGTDHTREFVPVLFFGPGVTPGSLGRRKSFADMGQTVAVHLGIDPLPHGTSCF